MIQFKTGDAEKWEKMYKKAIDKGHTQMGAMDVADGLIRGLHERSKPEPVGDSRAMVAPIDYLVPEDAAEVGNEQNTADRYTRIEARMKEAIEIIEHRRANAQRGREYPMPGTVLSQVYAALVPCMMAGCDKPEEHSGSCGRQPFHAHHLPNHQRDLEWLINVVAEIRAGEKPEMVPGRCDEVTETLRAVLANEGHTQQAAEATASDPFEGTTIERDVNDPKLYLLRMETAPKGLHMLRRAVIDEQRRQDKQYRANRED